MMLSAFQPAIFISCRRRRLFSAAEAALRCLSAYYGFIAASPRRHYFGATLFDVSMTPDYFSSPERQIFTPPCRH